MSTNEPYRVGWINYTNAAPILEQLVLSNGIQAITGVPTSINTALLNGDVKLANISAVEFIKNADKLAALPDFSISVLGPVYSVCLFHSKPLEQLERIALTSQSATSVALLQLLLTERGLKPVLERAEGQAHSLLTSGFDGVLRIGDSALQEWYSSVGPLDEHTTMLTLTSRRSFVTDLSALWYQLTGHPFVFAVWAYHKHQPPPSELVQAMRVARRAGLGNLAALSQRQAHRLALPERVLQHYLWNFRYHLEEPDKRGLAEFAQRVCPKHAPLSFL